MLQLIDQLEIFNKPLFFFYWNWWWLLRCI